MRVLLRCLLVLAAPCLVCLEAKDLRLGMIGLDTGHVVAFTKILHDTTAKDHVPGARVVGAFKAASPDIESSHSLVDGYVKKLRDDFGVTMYERSSAVSPTGKIRFRSGLDVHFRSQTLVLQGF